MKEARKPLGGEIEVHIRIKTPLVKKDVRTVQEKVLVFDGPLPTISQPSTTPEKTSPVPQAKSVALPNSTISLPQATLQEVSDTPANTAQQVKPQPVKNASASVDGTSVGDMELEDVISIENIVSNDVLEAELESVNGQLATYATNSEKPPESLDERKAAIELKLNLLVIQVQSGQLTPESYIEILKKKIEEDTNLARKLVAAGKKDWARYPLVRTKIMRKEVEVAAQEAEEEG